MIKESSLTREGIALSKEGIEALKGSIKKWEGIVAGTTVDQGIRNCPLCMMFDCKECPVYMATGQENCNGTPYQEWTKHQDEKGEGGGSPEGRVVHCPTCRALAGKEVEFLKSLLPKEREREFVIPKYRLNSLFGCSDCRKAIVRYLSLYLEDTWKNITTEVTFQWSPGADGDFFLHGVYKGKKIFIATKKRPGLTKRGCEEEFADIKIEYSGDTHRISERTQRIKPLTERVIITKATIDQMMPLLCETGKKVLQDLEGKSRESKWTEITDKLNWKLTGETFRATPPRIKGITEGLNFEGIIKQKVGGTAFVTGWGVKPNEGTAEGQLIPFGNITFYFQGDGRVFYQLGNIMSFNTEDLT